jgi:hypothetical protein
VVEENRRDFWVYIEEFHTFTTLSTATMLSELRKYHVGLILTHQFLSQIERQIRDAILGNAGRLFRFGLELPMPAFWSKSFYLKSHRLI